ncbi:MAG: CRISPR-associated endonuclease Cas2 [Calditrichaeota bacterium]|nr:MAG: CRISPR-associated endonuclease Cas2 [Calditrichota bacterium]
MSRSSTDKNFVVVVYDIVENKARNKVLKLLKGYGDHIQKSAFECFLTDEQVRELRDKIMERIDCDKDTVRMYILNEAMRRQTRILGLGRIYEDEKVLIV